MSGPFKLKSGNTPLFKNLGSSPGKLHEPGHETKEIKGTSIFGKSPKEFAKSIVDPLGLYRKGKKAYDTYKGKKAVKQGIKDSIKKSVSKGASEAVTEGGKMGLMEKKGKLATKQSMKKVKGKLKRTMTNKMKPKTNKEKSDAYDKRMIEHLKKNYKTPAGAR